AARDFDDLQPAGPLVVGFQCLERGLHVLPWFAIEQLAQGLGRDGFRGRKDQRFDDRFQMVRHNRPLYSVSGAFTIPAATSSLPPSTVWAATACACRSSGSSSGFGASAGRARLYTRIGPIAPD